jgi:hypothetical protein
MIKDGGDERREYKESKGGEKRNRCKVNARKEYM